MVSFSLPLNCSPELHTAQKHTPHVRCCINFYILSNDHSTAYSDGKVLTQSSISFRINHSPNKNLSRSEVSVTSLAALKQNNTNYADVLRVLNAWQRDIFTSFNCSVGRPSVGYIAIPTLTGTISPGKLKGVLNRI